MIEKRLAHTYAEDVVKNFALTRFLDAMHIATPQAEHKAMVPILDEHLADFLERVGQGASGGRIVWEGNPSKEQKQRYSYQILGALTFPDASVLTPSRCAFEFDREARRESDKSSFKRALMKAAVHVLCGAYEACVLVFSLQQPDRTRYLNDNERTKEFRAFLEERGLYVAVIPALVASSLGGQD